MSKFTSQIKKVFSNLVLRFTKKCFYLIKYFSEKAKEVVSRISEGKPRQMANGNFLYKDVAQEGKRSYKPKNLRSIKMIAFVY